MELTRRRLIYLIAGLMDFAYFMFIFTVTRTFPQKGATLLDLGFLGGAISCSYAISGVIVGHLSDRWGRRRTIVLGISTLIVAYVLCCLWPKQLMLYLVAALAGMAAGIVNPPLIAWLADPTTRRS